MKRILSILLASLFFVFPAGCGGGQSGESEDTANKSIENKNNNAPQVEKPQDEAPQNENLQDETSSDTASVESKEITFTLDGVAYQLPCPFADLADNGWRIVNPAYTDSLTIEGHKLKIAGISKGENYIEVAMANTDELPQPAEKCEVREIAVTRGWLENAGVFSFKNGLTTESSEENIAAAMDVTFEESTGHNYARFFMNGNGTKYEFFWFDDTPERNSIFIRFTSNEDDITADVREQAVFPNMYKDTESVSINISNEAKIPDIDVFVQFLQGQLEVSLNDPSQYKLAYVSFGEAGNYTLKALRDAVNKNSFRGFDSWGYNGYPFEKIYYGVWETLSGGNVLAIKFQNMGIYDPMDTSYALFIFAVNEEGALEMIYAYDSWCRNEVEILNGGAFYGIGDGGTSKGNWFGFLDAAGHYQEVYQLYTDHNAGFSGTRLSTEDGSFYTYTSDGTNQKGVDMYIAEMEGQGAKYTDNIDGIIQDAYTAFEIDADALQPYDTWTLWIAK